MMRSRIPLESFREWVLVLRETGTIGPLETCSLDFLLLRLPEMEQKNLALPLLLLLWESRQGRVRLHWSVKALDESLEELLATHKQSALKDGSHNLSRPDWLDLKDDLEPEPHRRWEELVSGIVDDEELEEHLPNRPLVFLSKDGDGHLYLQKNFVSEARILRGFSSRLDGLRGSSTSLADDLTLEDLYAKRSILGEGQRFHLLQGIAAVLASQSSLFLLSGGPGTGKTSVLLQVLRMVFTQRKELQPSQVALVAPTGRAKARMQESLELGLSRLSDEKMGYAEDKISALESQTLHRLLGVERDERFQKPGKLSHRLVVIDEASMVDIHLMGRLMDRLSEDASLILMGDVDQLPSVEHGAILGDLSIGSGATLSKDLHKTLSVKLGQLEWDGDWKDDWIITKEGHPMMNRMILLERTYRSAQRILELASSLSESGMEERADSSVMKILNESRFSFGSEEALKEKLVGDTLPGSQSEVIHINSCPVDKLLVAWRDAMDQSYGSLTEMTLDIEERLESLDLTPSEVDDGSELCSHLSAVFDRMVKDQILCIQHGGGRGTQYIRDVFSSKNHRSDNTEAYASGQRLLVKENLRGLDLYNGDVGLVMHLKGSPLVVFRRGARFIEVSLFRVMAHLETADAITVHKSQGSEYDQVLLLLPDKDHPMVTREILYTAITRAKHRVLMMGPSELIEKGAGRTVQRPSRLGDWIQRSQ